MTGNAILLSDIWPIDNPSEYKIHFGTHNGDNHPLDLWLEERVKWQAWQEWHPRRNEFNRGYVFSSMQFYHDGNNIWLFGGIFRVIDRVADSQENHGYRYIVELTECGKQFIGRLKFTAPSRSSRSARVNFENHYDSIEVLEILREPYSGRPFPGYENINVTFPELRLLVLNDRPDWRSSLESVHGIYMVTDTNTGKRYVGSAYGEGGIWSRWESYSISGHGNNKNIRRLLGERNWENYTTRYFRFALLEYHPRRTSKDEIIEREEFWKRMLLTKGKYGLND